LADIVGTWAKYAKQHKSLSELLLECAHILFLSYFGQQIMNGKRETLG